MRDCFLVFSKTLTEQGDISSLTVCTATLDEIKNEPRFAGVIDRGVYIPHIYSQTRKKWIESFLAQNGFIGA